MKSVRDGGEFIRPRKMQYASGSIHKFCPKFTFHSLRHTYCTRLLEAGAQIKFVQERFGNNPMVGATVACAVAVEEAMK